MRPFLLQHGAESALVDELSTRLGLALGMDSVESSISSNAIVLTTIKDGQCLTSTRKNSDRGINMHVVTEVQHIVIMTEHKLLDAKDVEKRFSQVKPLRYPRWLVTVMVGLSCACFCRLNNGGWDGAFITFCASSMAMYVRLVLANRHMHPQINFASPRSWRPPFPGLCSRCRFSCIRHGRHGRKCLIAGPRLPADQCRRRYV
jgi:uncharacterized membrane protein YjjP (DUF1212 family)